MTIAVKPTSTQPAHSVEITADPAPTTQHKAPQLPADVLESKRPEAREATKKSGLTAPKASATDQKASLHEQRQVEAFAAIVEKQLDQLEAFGLTTDDRARVGADLRFVTSNRTRLEHLVALAFGKNGQPAEISSLKPIHYAIFLEQNPQFSQHARDAKSQSIPPGFPVFFSLLPAGHALQKKYTELALAATQNSRGTFVDYNDELGRIEKQRALTDLRITTHQKVAELPHKLATAETPEQKAALINDADHHIQHTYWPALLQSVNVTDTAILEHSQQEAQRLLAQVHALNNDWRAVDRFLGQHDAQLVNLLEQGVQQPGNDFFINSFAHGFVLLQRQYPERARAFLHDLFFWGKLAAARGENVRAEVVARAIEEIICHPMLPKNVNLGSLNEFAFLLVKLEGHNENSDEQGRLGQRLHSLRIFLQNNDQSDPGDIATVAQLEADAFFKGTRSKDALATLREAKAAIASRPGAQQPQAAQQALDIAVASLQENNAGAWAGLMALTHEIHQDLTVITGSSMVASLIFYVAPGLIPGIGWIEVGAGAFFLGAIASSARAQPKISQAIDTHLAPISGDQAAFEAATIALSAAGWVGPWVKQIELLGRGAELINDTKFIKEPQIFKDKISKAIEEKASAEQLRRITREHLKLTAVATSAELQIAKGGTVGLLAEATEYLTLREALPPGPKRDKLLAELRSQMNRQTLSVLSLVSVPAIQALRAAAAAPVKAALPGIQGAELQIHIGEIFNSTQVATPRVQALASRTREKLNAIGVTSQNIGLLERHLKQVAKRPFHIVPKGQNGWEITSTLIVPNGNVAKITSLWTREGNILRFNGLTSVTQLSQRASTRRITGGKVSATPGASFEKGGSSYLAHATMPDDPALIKAMENQKSQLGSTSPNAWELRKVEQAANAISQTGEIPVDLSTRVGRLTLAKLYGEKIRSGSIADVYIADAGAMGLGLYARNTIKRGEFIGEYAGQIVPRTPSVLERGYSFGLRPPFAEVTSPTKLSNYVIDASEKGNVTRFINSSETPNAEAYYMFIDGYWRVVFVAKQQINPGEQLFVNYGKNYWKGRRTAQVQ